MSKLFSPLSLLDEHTSLVSMTSTDSYIDDSFFVETLNFLTEQTKEFSLLNAQLYRNINESADDPIIVRESFSDFFDGVKKFIKNIIKFIKKLIAKFWVRINSLFLRDKYIEQHKDELAKFGSAHEFDISGYNFTFEEGIPSLDVLQTLEDSIADFKVKGNGAKDSKELKKAYDTFIDAKNSNSHLDSLRKECIGAKANIDESDYKDEVFKVFRNGDKDQSKIVVTNAIVVEALAFFTGYDKMKTSTQRHADNVEKLYNQIQKRLDSVTKTTVDGKEVVTISDFVDKDSSADKIAIYDLFMKAKSQEIQEISNMHLLAFSAKLDALKQCFDQDKKIMYGAFKKILAKNEAADMSRILQRHAAIKAHIHDDDEEEESENLKERKARLAKHLKQHTEALDIDTIYDEPIADDVEFDDDLLGGDLDELC